MRIERVGNDKRGCLPPLLPGDGQEEMTDRYPDRGELRVPSDGPSPVAVAAVAGFFIRHHDRPIVEAGIVLTDMVYLKKLR